MSFGGFGGFGSTNTNNNASTGFGASAFGSSTANTGKSRAMPISFSTLASRRNVAPSSTSL